MVLLFIYILYFVLDTKELLIVAQLYTSGFGVSFRVHIDLSTYILRFSSFENQCQTIGHPQHADVHSIIFVYFVIEVSD